jgi:hypothetical protein
MCTHLAHSKREKIELLEVRSSLRLPVEIVCVVVLQEHVSRFSFEECFLPLTHFGFPSSPTVEDGLINLPVTELFVVFSRIGAFDLLVVVVLRILVVMTEAGLKRFADSVKGVVEGAVEVDDDIFVTHPVNLGMRAIFLGVPVVLDPAFDSMFEIVRAGADTTGNVAPVSQHDQNASFGGEVEQIVDSANVFGGFSTQRRLPAASVSRSNF